MAFSVKDDIVHQKVRQLADITGENMTRAIEGAVDEQLMQLKQKPQKRARYLALMRFIADAPPLTYHDKRTLKEITDDLCE